MKIFEEKAGELPEIPNVKFEQVIDLVQKITLIGDTADKEGLAYALGVQTKNLSSVLRAAELLDLVTIVGDHISLTEWGHKMERSDDEGRRTVFGKQLLNIEPFITIARGMERENEMDSLSVLKLMKAKLPSTRKWNENTDKEMLKLILNWAEYGKILTYDSESKLVRRFETTPP